MLLRVLRKKMPFATRHLTTPTRLVVPLHSPAADGATEREIVGEPLHANLAAAVSIIEGPLLLRRHLSRTDERLSASRLLLRMAKPKTLSVVVVRAAVHPRDQLRVRLGEPGARYGLARPREGQDPREHMR